MSNEIVKREDNAVQGMSWATMVEQAKVMVRSGFLPQAIKTPEQAVAIAMTGKELGLGMMQSFRSINVIQGKPTLSVQLMLALAQRTGELEDQKLEAIPDRQNPTKVVYTIKRKGQSPHTEEFGDQEARAMQLLDKDNYKKQKFTMFKWRAVANALRFVFGDILHGVYAPEELGAEVEVTEDGEAKVISIPETRPSEIIETKKVETVEKVEQQTTEKTEEKQGLLSITIFVDSVEDKMSKGNKEKGIEPKPFAWIHDVEGVKYFSYSQTSIALIKRAQKSGQQVTLYYESTKFGPKVIKAELIGENQGTASNNPDFNEGEIA